MRWNEGNVFVLNDFDDNMEGNIVLDLTLQIQEQAKVKDGGIIDLYINSFGGYAHLVFHLIELVELAKRQGTVVRTIVPSVAFSAGSMLAVAGTPGERYISKAGEHLIHYGRTGSVEETPKQVERFAEYKKRDFKNTLAHYQKYANVPNLDTEMMDDGWFIPAKDCVKWKLADKFLDKFDISASVQ